MLLMLFKAKHEYVLKTVKYGTGLQILLEKILMLQKFIIINT